MIIVHDFMNSGEKGCIMIIQGAPNLCREQFMDLKMALQMRIQYCKTTLA